MISEERLKEIEALAEAATPGPWSLRRYGGKPLNIVHQMQNGPPWRQVVDSAGKCQFESDAEYIIAAAAAVPELIAEVRRLRMLVQSGNGGPSDG